MNLFTQIETLFQAGSATGLTDAHFLERFAHACDEAAFGALVDRYGSMVLRVCREVLGNEADAQDASQATFLVLARRAGSIGRRESVASWLHGVAVRVAAPPAGGRAAAGPRMPRGEFGARRVATVELGKQPAKAMNDASSFMRSWITCPRRFASRSCSATSRA